MFIDRKYIGGHKEIMLLHRTGALEEILNVVKLESAELEKIKMAYKEEVETVKEENQSKTITDENNAQENKQDMFT